RFILRQMARGAVGASLLGTGRLATPVDRLDEAGAIDVEAGLVNAGKRIGRPVLGEAGRTDRERLTDHARKPRMGPERADLRLVGAGRYDDPIGHRQAGLLQTGAVEGLATHERTIGRRDFVERL